MSTDHFTFLMRFFHSDNGVPFLIAAWMATLLAVNYPERVHSLLLIGSAVNQCLDDDVFENIVSSLDEEVGGEAGRRCQ